MSYRNWSVDGLGININDAANIWTDDTEKFSNFKNYAANLFSEGQISPEVLMKALSLKSVDDFMESVKDYESFTGYTGAGFFIVDVMNYIWEEKGHSVDILTSVQDDFGDGSTYWLVNRLYPWGKYETFKDAEDCEKTIRETFKDIFGDVKVDFYEIEQGG